MLNTLQHKIRYFFKRIWSEPRTASELAIARIFFYGTLIALFAPYDFTRFSNLSAPFWDDHSFYTFFDIFPLSVKAIVWLHRVWILSLALCFAGLLWRFSSFVCFILGSLLLGMERGFIDSNFQFQLINITLGLMFLSEASRVYSLDAYLDKKRMDGNEKSQEFGWTFRLVKFIFVWMFFSAAYSKLSISGIGWLTRNQLFDYIVITGDWFSTKNETIHGSARSFFLAHPVFTQICAYLVVLWEITAPAVLYYRRLELHFVLTCFVFFLCTWAVFSISTTLFFISLLGFWLPWEKILVSIGTFSVSRRIQY